MTGVVLCGGRSTRMGKDKGLIFSERGSKVWAELIRDKFATIAIPSLLSINHSQLENYALHFNEKEFIIDNSSLKIQGPLLGLLSVHLKIPHQDLMVIACDMIHLNEMVLKKLSDHYPSSKAEATVFRGERIEPLCGIYSSRGLHKIYNAYQEKALSNNSMMHALEKLQTSYLPIPEKWESSFKNFNSAEEVN